MLDDNFLLRCKEDEIPIITKEEIDEFITELNKLNVNGQVVTCEIIEEDGEQITLETQESIQMFTELADTLNSKKD